MPAGLISTAPFLVHAAMAHDPLALTAEQSALVQRGTAAFPPRWRARFLSAVAETLNPNPTNRDGLTAVSAAPRALAVGIGPPFDGIVICHPSVPSRRPLLARRKAAVRVGVVGEPTKKKASRSPLLLTQPKLCPL
jgi:hypothetical protein